MFRQRLSGARAQKKFSIDSDKPLRFPALVSVFLLIGFIFFGASKNVFSQTVYQPNYLTNVPQNNNYLANSSAFKQEIARVEINVMRKGREILPITQVPRLEQDDVLKIKLSEELVNGVKPDQSNWDWSLLVAFINPGRNSEKGRSVSQEIQFRKTGWYKEYSVAVPYDSQPIFFLYTKSKYRDKILSLIDRDQDEIRKIGEKTIEISGAYAMIDSFLNELQSVINMSQYYGYYGGSGNYGNYGNYSGYNNSYGTYNSNGAYGTNGALNVGFNKNLFMAQSVERLARSFNIQLPGCWQGGNNFYGGSYNNYGSYGNNGAYNGNIYNNYGNYGNFGYGNNGYNNFGISNDLIGRAQCVAKSVRLEDFDLSVSRMLQQGGILAAAQLSQKYPQISFWINVAAAALDLIVKMTRKTPMRIVPTVITTADAQPGMPPPGLNYQSSMQGTPAAPNAGAPAGSVKISLFAEAPPNDSNFITAYPLVINKWQANADPQVLNLPPPVLTEQCLHAGPNLLQSTDVINDWMADQFSKDFKLVVGASNGFRKEFPLKKNVGLSGWEFNLTKEDINAFPKIDMRLDAAIVGRRGFNEISSAKFAVAVPVSGSWEVAPESRKSFAAGGKRVIILKNLLGSCKCLQSVVYKPSFGGEFVFEANRENGLLYSEDGKEVSFQIDATSFQPGQGQLELRQYGAEVSNLNLNLYATPPVITDVKIAKGDHKAVIVGTGLEQIKAIKINDKRAIAEPNSAGVVAVEQYNPPTNYQNGASGTPAAQNVAANNYAAQNYSYQQPGNSPAQYNSPNGGAANSGGNAQPYNYQPNGVANQPPAANGYVAPSQYIVPGSQYVAPSNVQNNQPVNLNNQNSGAGNYTAQTEKTFVFEDSGAQQTANTVSLEFELEDSRTYRYPKTFDVSLARPRIAANSALEVDGAAINSPVNPQFNLNLTPVFPIETSEVSVNLQNVLTDYDFKYENISIEVRLENGQTGQAEMPTVSFEVLDWKNITARFLLGEKFQRQLGGRRLQFRIRDRERGNSDWYTLRNTFVRLPQIAAVKCSGGVSGNCIMSGAGLEYISQVSVDGGKTWTPLNPSAVTASQLTTGDRKTATVPFYANKKLLQVKLRDLTSDAGLPVNEYLFSGAAGRRN